MRPFPVASLLFAISLVATAVADTVKDADSALMRGDYPTAVGILKSLSDTGDPAAQVRLANLYQRGEGVPHDKQKAVNLYLAAAEKANADAQFNLGNMYLLGEGVPQDEDWALTFYRLAAKQGHALAARNMRELMRANGITDAPAAITELSPPSRATPPAVRHEVLGPDASARSPKPGPGESRPRRTVDTTGAGRTGVEQGVPAAPSGLLDDEPRSTPAARDARTRSPTSERARAAAPADEPERRAPVADAGSDRSVADPARSPAPPVRSEDESKALRLAAQHGILVKHADVPAAQPDVAADRPAAIASVGILSSDDQRELFERAQRALALENYDHALTTLRELAAGGHGGAAMTLAALHTDGRGVERNEELAMQWRRQAAVLGNVEAQFDLAQRYERGHGVAQDEAMAITYYRSAARGGHVKARERLKALYEAAGFDVPDLTRPEEPAGNVPGAGDDEHAGAAADTRETATATNTVAAATPGPDIAIPTPARLTPAKRPAIADIERGKRALRDGNPMEALRIFTALGAVGDAEAQANLGYLYDQGEDVAVDRERAVDWYRRSAVQGHRDAQYNLAVAFAFGEGVAQDDAQAATGYRRAAEQGYAAAQYNPGYSYRTGRGVNADEDEAIRWFERAAADGHASAQYRLGSMYRTGRGVDRDVDEALKRYRLAAEQGHPAARADLASLSTAM